MRIVRELTLFAIGGAAYVGIELCYRGYSHWSMFLLGGLCFFLIGRLPRALPVPVLALCGGAIITALEYLSGLLLNRVLGLGIWDYSHLPGNLQGQICPQLSALWCGLSVLAVYADGYLRHWLFAAPAPRFRWW